MKPRNVEWFVDAIDMGAIKLPELQGQYHNIQNKVWRTEHQKQELERDYHAIQRETVELTQTHNMLQQNFDTLAAKVDDLYNEKCGLEQFVSRFKNGNRHYLEIRNIAEEIVYGLLSEHGALLTSAIISVIDTREYVHKRETAFSFYILWMCAHAYAMRQRKILDDNEWAGWSQWMRNCFRRGTIGEIWKQVEPDGWFNPAFQKFLNAEIIE